MSKVKNSIVMLTSPFQCLTAIEFFAVEGFDTEITLLIDDDIDHKSQEQIIELIDYLNVKKTIKIKLIHIGDLTQRIHSYSRVLQELENNYTYVLIGDIRHQWMQDIACSVISENRIILDDGAATLPICEHILKPNSFNIPVMLFNSTIERKLEVIEIKNKLGLNTNYTKVKLFSVFDFNENSYGVNKFPFFKEKYNAGLSSKEKIDVCWHFIGSPVVEKELIDEDEYFNVLTDALARNKEKSIAKPVYVVHRSENIISKYDKLISMGFVVVENEKPYELYLLSLNQLPSKIVSFHSTCLFNVSVMFGDLIDKECYMLSNKSLCNLKNKHLMHQAYTLHDHVKSIYNRMSEYNIGMIQLG